MKISSAGCGNPPARSLSHAACARMIFLATALSAAPAAYGALSVTPATITLSCTTNGGPGAAVNVAVKPTPVLTGSTTIAVTLGTLPAGIIAVTTPANQTLSTANQGTGIIYTLNFRPGCVGATAGNTQVTFRARAAGVDDATVTVNRTVTAATSALTPAPSAATILCIKSGSTYTPGAAKTVSVTSAATGGTPFTVDTATNPVAAWLTVTPTTGGSAAVTGISFTVQAAAGCGGFAVSTTNTTTVHLLNAPAPDKNIVVTLQVLPPTPITAAPASPRLTYVKNSGGPGYVDVTLTSSTVPAPFFTVDTSTLPIWLTVDFTSGRTPKALRFSSTAVSDNLPPGTYNASIAIKVSGSGDLTVPISILLTNTAPKLTVAEGITRNIFWTIGSAAPTAVVTAVSTDSPISYSATTGGTLAPALSASQRSGLAYSFGTQMGITFDPTVLGSAAPGTVLTGTVTLTWGSPAATTVITFNLTVLSPGATLSGISPASLPTAASGQSFTLALSGGGFVASPDPAVRTRVAIVVSGVMVNDNNISWTVVNPSNILLTINVPVAADPYLPFSTSGAGGTVTIGVCSPAGAACTTPSGTAQLTIGNGPIIQVVTSASSFVQVSPGVTPSVAPYEVISIFGTNFCSSNGTGCSSSQILYGSPDSALRYPTTLSPDASGATRRSLKVKFQTQGSSPTLVADANLLFATNNQLNLIVPAGTFASIGSTLDTVVSFGFGTGTTLRSSAPFPVNIVSTDPGVFTVGSNGQGQAAALLPADYSLVGAGNEAGMRSTGSDSTMVLLYLTGLGAPDSIADNASTGGSAWSGDCISPSSYLTSLNAQSGGSLTTVDGVILQSGLLSAGRLAPCILSNSANVPSVTIGGVAGTVSYAGWVADSMAGMYQINVKLPATGGGPFTDIDGAAVTSITRPVQLPVVVTSASHASQVGVGLWVAPKLKVVAPTALTGTVGTAWASSSNLVVATQGTTAYRYAVTSGLLPAGLALNVATGAISGTPVANTAGTYAVTVTATDSANYPIKDSVTFTLTIAGGLVVNITAGPYTRVFGASAATLTTATAISGLFPYTYAITAPGTVPTGLTLNATTGVLAATAAIPAGTYNVTITGTDSTSGTPLTGGASFPVVVALSVTNSTPTSGTAGQINANLTTVSQTGHSGTPTYAFDATTSGLGWFSISAGGVVSTSALAVAGTYPITVTATDSTTAPGAASAGVGTVTFSVTIAP